MRTLKKTLALVLCLAMIAGLCCFGTSAAFADAAEIEQTEAVAVMNAISVLKGDGTNFNPKGILTRAEAAVMIAKLIGEGDLKATSTYKDMAGFEWAQNFAAVCEAKGLIKGDGAGNFMPGQTLTGYQFGLMLCRALGYNPSAEGVEGATYEIGTAALMKRIGLNKAIENFDGTAALTRENAAALMLKALKTTMVKYTGGSTVTINGVVITTGADLEKVADANLASRDFIDATGDDIQLGEMYFDTLKLAATGNYDAYGRPAAVWTYGKTNTEICRAATEADYTATVAATTAAAASTITNTTTAAAALNKVLGITNPNALLTVASTTYWVNGVEATVNSTVKFENGDVVEVFTGDDLSAERVVITRESAAKIINVTPNTGKAKVTINGVPTVYNYNIYLDTDFNGVADITTTDLQLPGYTADYVKGAYLQVVVKSGAVIKSALTTPVTGAISGYSAGATATVAGTTYGIANASIPAPISVDFVTGKYALVLSSTGVVVGIDTVAAAAATLTDVVYTGGTAGKWIESETKYGVTSNTVYMQVVALDGTVSDVVIGGFTGVHGTDADNGYGVATTDGTNVSYATINAGLYVISDVPATLTVPAYKSLSGTMPTGYTKTSTTETSTAFDAKLTKLNGNYLTSATNYLMVSGSGATTKTKTYVGAPSYTTSSLGETVYVIYKSLNNEVVNVVFPASTMTLTSDTVLYVSAATTVQNGATTYLQSNVYDMAGNKLDAITVVSGSASATKFNTYTVDALGVYTLGDKSPSSVTTGDWAVNTGVKYYEGITFVKNGFYADRMNVTDGTYTLSDVPAANIKVVDVRTPADAYLGSFTTLADLITCASTQYDASYYYDVQGDLYMDANGAATFFVTGTVHTRAVA